MPVVNVGGRRQKSEAKVKNLSATSKRMLRDFRPQLPLIIVIIFLSILSAVLSIMAPIILRDFLNGAIPTNGDVSSSLLFSLVNGVIYIKWNYFFLNFGLMIGLYILSAITSFLAEWFSVNIGTRFAYEARQKIKLKIDKLPLSYFDKVPYGDTLSTGTNDVDNISRNLQSIITQIFSSVALFLGTLVAMFVTKWEMALVAVASLPLIIFIVWFISRKSQKQFVNYRSQLGTINGKIEENYSGYKIVKLFNKESDAINDFNVTNNKMAKSDRLSQFFSGVIWPSTMFVNNLCYVAVAVIGGLLKDPASMIVFFMFLRMFTSPFQQIGQIVNIIQSVLASQERIYSLLDENEEVPDVPDAISDDKKIKGNYVFDNVAFSYSPDKPLIDNLNLKISSGDTIAIVGPTGAGKTTLVNLLMRFYDIDSGSIKLDDVDIRDYKRKTLRGAIGMVLQDTWLFKGTICENIKYGNPDATDEEMIDACKQAYAYHFIETLPNTFDFVLNEEGSNISQGQKQLLTIARAILSKPKILILDEATSSVDTRTEQQIQDAMAKIMSGRTSFVIAHRLSTIKNAKKILVMQKGHIIESGTHEELLKLKGFYAELYNAQFLGTIQEETTPQTVTIDS
jgi:ATP-binding cassette subfamily B multidrug efflux pump